VKFFILAKAIFNRAFNAELINDLESEIDALNQKLGRQTQQLKQQQKRLNQRKDAAFGEQARNLAYKLTIDELCKRLLLTVEQKDELLAKSWELALGQVEKKGAVVPLRYILAKSVRDKRKVQRSSN
jgi:predicted transcriptional regulator